MAKSPFSQLTVALTAVVVSSVVAAAGLTVAQTGETCNGQAKPTDWRDCEVISCSSTSGGTSNWQCTQMKTTSGGGSCPGSPPTTTSWCDMSTGTATWKESSGGGYTGGSTGGSGSCPGSPPTTTSWCDNGAWREGSSTGGSGGGSCPSPYPMGGPFTCDSGVFKCYGVNIPDSSRAGEYTCTPDNGGSWKQGTTSGGGCSQYGQATKEYRCCQNPSLGECSGSNWGGGGGAGTNRHNCYQYGRVNGVENVKVYCRNFDADCSLDGPSGRMLSPSEFQPTSAPTSCDDWGSQTGGGYGGGYTSGGGGSGGSGSVEWCYYSATRNGSDLGYSIACPKGSIIDCHRETRAGSSVDSVGLVLGKIIDGQCWWEGGGTGGNYGTSGGYGTGGGYGTTGGYGGTGGGSSMRRCIYHNVSWKERNQLKKAPGFIGRDVYCQEDYKGCDVLSTTAGTQKSLPVDTPKGYGIPDPWNDVSLGAPFCCEEGGSNKCAGSSMNCRDEEAYWTCIGGRNAPMDSARSRSCEEKHCWFRDGDSGGKGGGEGETCQQACERNLRDCQQPRASVAYSPRWCNETLEECVAKCPGGGGGKKGCGAEPPFAKELKNLRCEDGRWAWDKDTGNEKEFCQKFPNDPVCKKPGPGTLEEKLKALEQTISVLDEQVENLKGELADAKDAVTEKNDEIRALKKEKAPKVEINMAKKELKALKKAVSAIVSKGKKLARELRFREKEYERLSRQLPFFPPPMAQ